MKRAAWALSKTSARPQSWVDWLLGVVGIACVLLVAVLLWIEPTTTRSATHFVEAQRWIEPIDTPDWSTEGFEKLAFSAPMLSAANWQTTPLPDAIPAPAQSSTANDAAMARAWIRLRYAVPTSIKSSDKLAIYIPRIMGGAWSLWANGEVVANNAHDWKMQWNRPVYMTLRMQLSAPNTVIDIDVAVPFRTEQGYAVGSVWLGPTSAIAPLRAKRVLLQQTLPMVGLIVVLLLGVWSFHFWCIRRSETQHLYMTLAALSWLVFDIQYFHDLPSNAMGAAWFTAGLGLDGEDSGRRQDDVIDVPWFFTGFADFEIVEDMNGVGRQSVENLSDDLLAEKAETVV